jgi:hypothetical protein
MNKSTVLAFLDAEIERLQQARELLSGDGRSSGPNGNFRHAARGRARKRRHMSAAARRKISEAQKKRWAARKRGM